MVRIRSRYKPPGYRTAQLVLVPVIAALLALGGFVACDNEKESSWNSPQTSSGSKTTPATTPSTATGSSATTAPARTDTVAGSTELRASDQQDQQNFSPRSDIAPESIQLTPCQRSANACFASGGLDSLFSNLDGLSVNPGTGRFCFSFQDGCDRR